MASTTELHETTEHAADHAADHDDHHPSDWHYIKIAILLAILTALEVGLFVLEGVLGDGGGARAFLFGTLTLLMIVKFFIVAAEFMHLKYDGKLFTQLFVAGLVLAIIVYAVFFLAFDVFFG